MAITKLNPADYEMRDGEQALFSKLNETIDEVNSGGGGGGGGPTVESFDYSKIMFMGGFSNGSPAFLIKKYGNIIHISGTVKSTQTLAANTFQEVFQFTTSGGTLPLTPDANIDCTSIAENGSPLNFKLSTNSRMYVKNLTSTAIPANTAIYLDFTYIID